jgi:hypothetical protein
MPVLSHTSEFNINSNESDNTYQDGYRGTWQLDWLTKELQLPGATLRGELDYRTTLSDNLDQINSSSSDSREDAFNFRLDLRSPSGLQGGYSMDQSDAYSSRTPSTNPRGWRSTQTKNATLSWEVPRLPTVYARHSVRTTNEYFGTRQSHGSEELTTVYGMAFRAQPGNMPQEYRAETVIRQSEVYLPQRSSSSQRRSSLSGIRSLALGGIGNLTLDYDYAETSDARPGETQASLNSDGNYGLSLFGSVQGLPLEYSYNYHNVFSSRSSSPGENQSWSDLNFTFSPKVPAGRSARLNARYYVRDYEAQSRHTSQTTQSVNWSFAANPRTRGSISFEHNQFNDELGRSLTSEGDRLLGEVHYTIPKGRGEFSGVFSQESRREPQSDNENVNSGLSANARFNLDQRSSLLFTLEQQRASNEYGAFGEPRSTDSTTSGITYYIASGQGLVLNASWRQVLQKTQPSAASLCNQQFNLTLNYDTPAGWRYQFTVSSNDYSRDSLSGVARSYSTSDSIQALISYSF